MFQGMACMVRVVPPPSKSNIDCLGKNLSVYSESSVNNYLNSEKIRTMEASFYNQDDCLMERISCVLDVALKNAQNNLDKLESKNVSEKELNDAKLAKSILEIGKNGIDDIISEKYKNYANVKFAGIPDEKELRMKENKRIIHNAATLAAGNALIFSQSDIGDSERLTEITNNMVFALCKNYKIEDKNQIAVFAAASQILGEFSGKGILELIKEYVPGVGSLANAAITFSLHEATGWAIVKKLEKQKENTINEQIFKQLQQNNMSDYRKQLLDVSSFDINKEKKWK